MWKVIKIVCDTEFEIKRYSDVRDAEFLMWMTETEDRMNDIHDTSYRIEEVQ